MKPRWTTAAAICLALTSLAQTTAPTPTTQELDRLRAENEELRKEVATLKAKLATITPTPAETQPAKKETARKFTTMMDVLTNVPAELRPQAKAEWFKFTEGKFEKWVSEQMTGMILDTTMQWAGGSTMRTHRSNPDAEFVLVPGNLEGKHFTYFGADHAWTIHRPMMYLDEAGARKYDALKAGTIIKVKGVITSVSLKRKGYETDKLPTYTFIFELRDLELIPPK